MGIGKFGGPAVIAAFGPLFVINLPERDDRRRDFSEQLRKIGLDIKDPGVQVFDAVRPADSAGFPTRGARGCFLSHLRLLYAARDADLDSLIICEDDLDFSGDFNQRLLRLLPSLIESQWDLLYAGHGGLSSDQKQSIVTLPANQRVLTTHFMVMRRTFMLPLIGYLEAILSRPPGDPDGGPMHVDGAFSRFRADYPEYVATAVFPPLGHQRRSRTDVHDLRWFDRVPVVREIVDKVRKVRPSARRN